MDVKHGGDIFAAADRRRVPWQQVLDFSASINPLGPSPRVKEAILSSIDRIAHYPSLDAGHLRLRLASEWSVPEDQILVGAGAVDLMRDVCAYFGSGHLAVPAFSEFHRLWPSASLCSISAPENWPKSGALVVTRPVNPTGTLLHAEIIIEHLHRSDCTVLVDESFIDFTTAASMVTLTADFPRLLVLRSLTKFHALPGLRVGAVVGHLETIDSLSKLRPPWAVSVLAEQAALAALEDREHSEATRKYVQQERAWLAQRVKEVSDVSPRPSDANYLYIEVPYATSLVRFAQQHDILIRDCTGWPGCEASSIRIAVRRRWENERLLTMWKKFRSETSA